MKKGKEVIDLKWRCVYRIQCNYVIFSSAIFQDLQEYITKNNVLAE